MAREASSLHIAVPAPTAHTYRQRQAPGAKLPPSFWFDDQARTLGDRFKVSLFSKGNAIEDELGDAPNPKPTASDKAQFGKIASLYTAFSTDFGAHALDLCLNSGRTEIADPFSGMGTLAEVARTRAIRLQVSDISPFAVLSSAFRSGVESDIRDATERLEFAADRVDTANERDFFSSLLESLGEGRSSISQAIRSPTLPRHRVNALAVYIAALARIRLYKGLTGSNPTWVRRPEITATARAAKVALTGATAAARQYAKKLPPKHRQSRIVATCAPIKSLGMDEESLDAIVTSPPYANRTDYIRHYHPASELLIDALGADERTVRSEQIGTPLIRESDASLSLPRSVRKTLEDIRTHGSYASERYYYKGFLYYFTDMADALARMHTWLRPDGLLLLVVQDTYYKDLIVPTTDLLVDIGRGLGFSLTARRDWSVRNYLSHLSPHFRKSVRSSGLSESAIVLSK